MTKENSYALSIKRNGDTFYNRCFHQLEKNINNLIAKSYNLKNNQVIITSSGIKYMSQNIK